MECIWLFQFTVLDLIYNGKVRSVEGESLVIKLTRSVRNKYISVQKFDKNILNISDCSEPLN